MKFNILSYQYNQKIFWGESTQLKMGSLRRSLFVIQLKGLLFELSTDTPGFATDEPMETIGGKLALPPFLEPNRKEIEEKLRPLILN